MNQLSNAYAWEVHERWYYAESREAAAPIAVEVQRYDSDGRIVLYRPFGDSGVLIWDAEKVD